MSSPQYLVIEIAPGELQINYAWLPNWMGQNRLIVEELENNVLIPLVAENSTLNADEACREGHIRVCEYLDKKYQALGLAGMFDFLDAVKFVHQLEQKKG